MGPPSQKKELNGDQEGDEQCPMPDLEDEHQFAWVAYHQATPFSYSFVTSLQKNGTLAMLTLAI